MAFWDRLFPSLSSETDEAIERFKQSAHTVALKRGEPVFHVGSPCDNYLLVVQGKVSVRVMTETGRQIVLYQVARGESCVLTTSCLLSGEPYPAEGVAETEVTAVAIGKQEFLEGLNRSAGLRRFVFENLGKRFAAVIARMSEVAFGSIDRRMAKVLLQHPTTDNRISLTHQGLALEMGSAREVVSRHLKNFEAQGWVRLGRGYVEILDHSALESLLSSNAV